ncbi:UNVERIFIED_CONTAM: RNA polymerase II associated protein 1 [Siphonaria sp. JEL0065]|nr:RNA polymerase II associated protein 1 [Siphonaria sp. JEL0065]
MQKKPSLFAQRVQAKAKAAGSSTERERESESEIVLGDIVEREPLRRPSDFAAPTLKPFAPTGFPSTTPTPYAALPSHAPGTASDIERENNNKLDSMTEDEIREAQAQITATFSEETIAKFRALHLKKLEKTPSPAGVSATVAKHPKKSISLSHENDHTDKADALSAAMQSYLSEDPYLVPPPSSEHSKQEWMTPVEPLLTESTTSSTDLRFSLNGDIIPIDADLPTHLGLHHHGDDPARAGYTIKELIYLARSSMSSQRSLCTQALVAIVKHFMVGTYSPSDSHVVGESIRAYMVLVHIRAAIDDSSLTIASIGLAGVAVALGVTMTDPQNNNTSASMDILETIYRFTKNGQFAFEQNQKSLTEIVSKWSGILKTPAKQSVYIEGMSNEDVSSLVISDVIPSLAETHLFERLHYLIVSKKLNRVDTELSLRILLRMAQHSIKVAHVIASTPGLVQSIKSTYLSIPWPNVNHASLKFAALSLRLMQSLLQSNLRNPSIAQILESANIVIRFLSLKPTANEGDSAANKHLSILYENVQIESFRLLSVLFDYGSTTHLFFDLRNEFVNTAISLLQTVKASPKVFDNKKNVWILCLSFWKMVASAAKLARNGVDGVSSETISPLVLVATEFFNLIVENQEGAQPPQLVLLSLLLEIFSEYLSLLVENGPAYTTFLEKLRNREARSLALVEKALDDLSATNVAEKPSRFLFGVATPSQRQLEYAILRSVNANLVEASLVFDAKLAKAGAISTPIDSVCIKVLDTLLANSQEKTDWTFIYSRGENDLRATILLKVAKFIKTPIKTISPCEHTILSSILEFIRTCLPTDADIFSHIFETLQFYPGFQQSTAAALQILSAEFSLETANNKESRTITFSQATLPAKPDWMFLPLSYNLEEKTDALRVVSTTLQFIKTLETKSREPIRYDGLKIASLMKLYLLPSVDGEEIYRLGDVTSCISHLLPIYNTTSSTMDLDHVFGGNTTFYKTYQELVAQYLSTSFGDVTFTNLVSIPLQMRYPYDFRALFWSEVNSGIGLKLVANQGGFSVDDISGLDAYLKPFENSEVVLDLYLEALVKGLVGGVRKGVFRVIAISHVSGYLFGEGVGGVEGFRRRVVEAVKTLDGISGGTFLDELFCGCGFVSEVEVERRRSVWKRLMVK